MPWIARRLRDAKVFAACQPSGELAVGPDQRVDILYRSGGKLYRASAKNLSEDEDTRVHSDEEVHPADEAADAAAAAAWLAVKPEQEEAAERAELMREVQSFRMRLQPRWRSFFDLYFVEGLDYEEIAKRLAIGKLRCKYMRKVLALRARRSKPLMAALGQFAAAAGRHAS